MSEIPEGIQQTLELRTMDVAIAGQKLDQLALFKGGDQLAYAARREVRKYEYAGKPTIEAIRDVFHLVANDKL